MKLSRFLHMRWSWLAIVVGALLVAGGTVAGVVVATSGGPTNTITADFAEAPGLYPGNFVDVLGVPVGHIEAVTPGPDFVAVRMAVDANVHIPAGVEAYLMAPNTVNDRYVQLDPAYTAGPTLGSGSVIPAGRTSDPVSVDQIVGSLDQLSVALGPKGANSNGELSQLFHAAALAFAGDGPQLHSTISSWAEALGALSTNTSAVTSLIDSMGHLTHTAAGASRVYETFAGDFAKVSSALAGDSTDIQQALTNFQQALGVVAQFIRTNGVSFGVSVQDLDQLAAAIGRQQQQLAQLLSASPLFFQNLQRAFDSNPPGGGGPALRIRYDEAGSTAGFTNAVCANSVMRLLLVVRNQSTDPLATTDLDCGVAAAIGSVPLPPGASSGPNLSLSALMGGSN